MKYLTIRNVSPELATALEEAKRGRGTSLNRTVLDLLEQALGVGVGRRRSNGLAALAGTWSEEEFEQFEAAVEDQERVDEELWQ
jgi:hypothetical protein